MTNKCADCGFELDYSDEDIPICWRCDALPCPFCGGSDIEWHPCGDEGDVFNLACGTVGCILSESHLDLWLSKDEAARFWNTRIKNSLV